jgi:hypothetical protein
MISSVADYATIVAQEKQGFSNKQEKLLVVVAQHL